MNRGFIGALILSVGFALLAGCGGSQPPIAASSAMPQSRTIVPYAGLVDLTGSSMLPGTSGGSLIYATGGCGGTCVISYPAGEVVGTLDVGEGVYQSAACTDSSGNVFITADDKVVGYAHGGTTPMTTLSLPGNNAVGCAVDPITNDLAVVFSSSNADIAVFPNESGSPTLYASDLDSRYCGYDNDGNLFVDGYNGFQGGLAELPSGGSSFLQLTVSSKVGTPPGQVQLDGKYMTYESVGHNPRVSRLKISGSKASIVGSVRFKGIKRQLAQSWIYGGQIFIPYAQHQGNARKLSIWSYPQGGKFVQTIDFGDYQKTLDLQGVALSSAPSQPRKR